MEKDPQALHEMKASIYKVRILTIPTSTSVLSPIFQHVSDSKVRYKWLDGGIHFIDAIPKNPSGKILVSNPARSVKVMCLTSFALF